MDHPEDNDMNLAGPCGFYCGTCRHYLARAKGKLAEKRLKHGCRGCRIQDKNCSWIKKGCPQVRKRLLAFCYECDNFPCESLRRLDERHVRDDAISLIANLCRIRETGVVKWLGEERERWRCPRCGGNLSVMDHECYDCGFTY